MKKLNFLTGIAMVMLLTMGCDSRPTASGIGCYSVEVAETVVDDFPIKQLQVNCPEGKKALGAGWSVLDSTSAILEGHATYFEPAYNGSGWLTNAVKSPNVTFTNKWKLRVRLICGCVTE
jgi:hypothetical protein